MTETKTVMSIFIQRFGLNPEDGSHLTIPCESYYRGFTMSDHLDFFERVLMRAPQFIPVDAWSNGYRYVFVSREDFAIFTYCEGDLDLTVDPDLGTFERRYQSAEEFYGKY